MKKKFSYLSAILLGGLLVLGSCSSNDDPPTPPPPPPDPGESTTELLVKKFTAAPDMDGAIDDMWSTAQRLVGTVEVPNAGNRNTNFSMNGDSDVEPTGLFEPYTGEQYPFKLRAGYFGSDIYLLLEWDDAADSQDRVSWYFDPLDNLWKSQHKFANNENDKFYEDKFAFQFPINDVEGFTNNTCFATCHTGLTVTENGEPSARHYTTNVGGLIDIWHWKRVRSSYEPTRLDDKHMIYQDNPNNEASAEGRKADSGQVGYLSNKKTLDTGFGTVNVPKYIIPGQTDYHWITVDQINDQTAKEVMAVDVNGVLTLDDGSSIDPSLGGFEAGTGDKRPPSVTTQEFKDNRGDVSITAVHTGTGWIVEISRKMDTGHPDDDVLFAVDKEIPFGLAIFNNAAIAHAIKNNLLMKFEQ